MGGNDAERKLLRRLARENALVCVSRNMYALPDYWATLDRATRAVHIARTLSGRHRHWVFAGLTAAAIHGFEHQWSLHDGTVTIIDSAHGATSNAKGVRRIYASSFPVTRVNAIPVTTPERTLIDCARTIDFRHALPIFDSAFAKGVAAHQMAAMCAELGGDLAEVMLLLRYVDSRSENGGESLFRGTAIEQRFMVPELQVEFTDPATHKKYRADFVWRLPDGKVIVGEFDGRAKYVNPSMTGGDDYMNVFQKERDREDALRRAGVTKVIRFTYQDVIRVEQLIDKLIAAGIPRCL